MITFVVATIGAAGLARPVASLPGEMAPAWGVNGVVELPDLLPTDTLAPQSDGSVVVVARTVDPKGGVVAIRLLANGQRDPSYGTGGRTVLPASQSAPSFGFRRIGVGADGSGRTLLALNDDQSRSVLRLLPNGRLDPTYGSNGSVAVNLSEITAMVVSPGGEALVAGDNRIVRLTPGGVLDRAFGSGGAVSAAGRIAVLAQDSLGRPVVVRTATLDTCGGEREPVCDFDLSRYLPDGRPDTAFGSGGSTPTDSSADLTTDADGRILSLEGEGRVVRYLADGRTDPSFADHGAGFGKLIVDSAGRVLVAGGGIARRQLPNGVGDQSFGRCGVAFDPDVNHTIAAGGFGVVISDGTLVSPVVGHRNFDPNRADLVIVGFQTGPGGPEVPYRRGSGALLPMSSGQILQVGQPCTAGSLGGVALNSPVVGAASTPTSKGYWLVAGDGGVFTFGDALFFGSTGSVRLNKPIVGMAATPSGNGYWLVASDGGVFTFGDATFFGSTGSVRLNKPIVGVAATPSGNGYWLVASDGGIFTFGDARFFGSTGNLSLNAPVLGMAAPPDGGGYWMLASDGGVFSFGDAQFFGSAVSFPRNQSAIGIVSSPSGHGYWVARDGGEFLPFGDAPGITGHGTMVSEGGAPSFVAGSRAVGAVLQ